MSWLDRISVDPTVERFHKSAAGMDAGLTGQYDQDLREKAGMRNPPAPPEFMGVEGEYDPSGLAKRVAIALDEDPVTSHVDGVSLVQQGATIALKGEVGDRQELERMVHIASQVDGTRAVNTDGVSIHS